MKKLFLLLITLLFIGCTGQAPVTHREQLLLISPSQEIAMGEKGYKEFLSKAKISTNKVQTERIRRIGKRIAIAANKKDYKWEFNLIDDNQVNAFCMPGGKVVVYTGILPIAKNDDQLATVMSHEIAHALARHGAERMSQQYVTSSIQTLGNVVVGATAPEYSDAFNIAYGYGTQLGIMLPYSRSQEYEADEIGIHLMKKAGYNINEAVTFWKNMQKSKGAAQPEFLSTHPSDEHRIQRIEAIVKKLNGK